MMGEGKISSAWRRLRGSIASGQAQASEFSRTARLKAAAWQRRHWLAAGGVVCATLLAMAMVPDGARAERAPAPATVNLPLPLPAIAPASKATVPAAEPWRKVGVKSGQTLSEIFDQQGLGYGTLKKILDSRDKDASALTDLHPGDELAFLIRPDGSLEALRFDRDPTHRVTVRIDGDKVTSHVKVRALERRTRVAYGVIKGSLFGAGVAAGMSDAMVMEMADVFKYDIDFIKSIRSGDRFTVIYNDVYRDGVFLHHGDIIAAEFINQGTRYTAFRFKMPDGTLAYFDAEGRPLRKALLRTPVKFTRISSRFSRARKHPILGYTRAHEGVDYAAPRGTPIHAAGDGVITIHGWVRGYGRYIRIKHNDKYSTCYAHMSRYAKGLHVGSHVRQGEVIGYVGMSGLATGPHLHYEVRVHGHPMNPLKVTLPKPKPLPAGLLAKFRAANAPWISRIQAVDGNLKLVAKSGS